MSFVSLTYVFFLCCVFVAWQLIASRRIGIRNALIVTASYVFYGMWDWRFLGLLLFTTVTTFSCALPRRRTTLWMWVAIAVNLAVLAFFKYFNFFSDNLRWVLANFGWAADWFTIDILLPVGISFYTFQAISYSIDVKRGDIAPCRNFISFAAFVAFFPQLVAGPIERARDLLPQFAREHRFSYPQGVEGLRRILWGLFKKVVVADGVAGWVDHSFADLAEYDGAVGSLKLAFGAVCFMLQIYGDFSGYSDIAKGSAQLFGFRLMDNFRYPFFSRNVIEYWHRWHISLMKWFTAYLYIPLGGSKNGHQLRNIFIVFLLSGLWHGASWTFIVWGAVLGLWYCTAVKLGKPYYKPETSQPATIHDLPKIVLTFMGTALVMVFFRAENVSQAIVFIAKALPGFAALTAVFLICAYMARMRHTGIIASLIAFAAVAIIVVMRPEPIVLYEFIMLRIGLWSALATLAAEWCARRRSFALEHFPGGALLRFGVYSAMLYLIVFGSIEATGQFIYFQF